MNAYMTLIVGIHGIAQQYETGPQLHPVWLAALKGGLTEAGFHHLADQLTDSELTIASWGALFRPPGTLGDGFPPFDISDFSIEDWDLLSDLYQAGKCMEPQLQVPDGSLGVTHRVSIIAERLFKSKTFSEVSQRAFVGSLKQVVRFLSDPLTKEAVFDRVSKAITAQTRIIVAHSLGSVIAYEYLCRYPETSIYGLITLGSPLGLPNAIYHKLTPKPEPKGIWPPGVTSWINCAAREDIVATPKILVEHFEDPSRTARIEDIAVNNGSGLVAPHSVGRYLNAAQTGQAFAKLLIEAK